jgi:uncharacterized YigZ family protein
MNDTYRVLDAPVRTERKVKGSRFIAEALPVSSVEAAEAAIVDLRGAFHDATHHCSAYRIGPDADRVRFNDDGEPGGTAGLPILRQLEARSLTDTLTVVIRYFGGTKLGTGGLARAYGDAAGEARVAGRVAERVVTVAFRLSFAYPDTSPAMHVLNRFGAELVGTTYAEDTTLDVAVRRSQEAAFREAFTDALSGRGTVHTLVK